MEETNNTKFICIFLEYKKSRNRKLSLFGHIECDPNLEKKILYDTDF